MVACRNKNIITAPREVCRLISNSLAIESISLCFSFFFGYISFQMQSSLRRLTTWQSSASKLLAPCKSIEQRSVTMEICDAYAHWHINHSYGFLIVFFVFFGGIQHYRQYSTSLPLQMDRQPPRSPVAGGYSSKFLRPSFCSESSSVE